MKLSHRSTLVQPVTGNTNPWKAKVTSICFSADNERLAVATTERVVTIYNDLGEKVDKFSTKPNGKGPKNYIVRGIQYCADVGHPKLAIAQSDCIVFVYKWSAATTTTRSAEAGTGRPTNNGSSIWKGKKSICNKFPEASPVTGLVWPAKHPFEVVYGLAEGNVKIGHLRSNKSQTLYKGDSPVVSVTTHPRGDGILSGHADGAIYRYKFPTQSQASAYSKIIHHSCPPYALAWGKSILAGGNDQQIMFYNSSDGTKERSFTYSTHGDEEEDEGGPFCREFTTAAFNHAGDSVIVGNFNCFYVYSRSFERDTWDDAMIKVVDNMYSVTSLAWKRNGTSLALGNMCGLVDVYDAYQRRYLCKKAFEVTHISPDTVRICNKDSISAIPVIVKASRGREIDKVAIYPEPESKRHRYVVARTQESLILSDMDSPDLPPSEVEWTNHSRTRERFLFDSPQACIISNAGELTVIEYGNTDVLCCVRTEYTSEHLLSLRINERPQRTKGTTRKDDGENKKIAYLLDQQTICVRDMLSSATTTIPHDVPIDFIELNSRGSLILFRDKKRVLHLFNVELQTRTTLLSSCSYIQWVPGSDVVVAQNSPTSMCVWYNIDAPDQVTTRSIKGEIEGIERSAGKTEVIVDETTSVSSYVLAEELIELRSAIDDNDLSTAVGVLESIDISRQTEALWHQLYNASLEEWNLSLAEKCAAAVGNSARARYLGEMARLFDAKRDSGVDDPRQDWQLSTKMLQLQKQFSKAENVYLANDKVIEAMGMYDELGMFVEGVRVALEAKHPAAEEKKAKYIKWLLETKQLEKAAAMKESEGDFVQAINLFLDAGFPLAAASVLSDHEIFQPTSLIDSVALALESDEAHDKAGDLHARRGNHQKALECFMRGKEYRQAIELAREHFPDQVVALQEDWGDHLAASGQVDSAIEHYLEAHVVSKALDAAVKGKRWNKVKELVDQTEQEDVQPHAQQLAQHFASNGEYQHAANCYSKAGNHIEAVSLLLDASMWDEAIVVARSFLSEQDISALYSTKAQSLEDKGKIHEAERLYIDANLADKAIDLCKRNQDFDRTISLVAEHRQDLMEETVQFVAKRCEADGDHKRAEEYLASAGAWSDAVKMYEADGMWEDAIRVARTLGGNDATKQVAYDLGIASSGGAKRLAKMNLIDPAIEYAIKHGAFGHAFDFANAGNPDKLLELHYLHAQHLEEEDRYNEAETEYIRAQRPREAIDMYLHQKQYAEATRVASLHVPSLIPDLLQSEAQEAAENGNFRRAEETFIEAGKPDMAVEMYRSNDMLEDAIRITKLYLPHLYQPSFEDHPNDTSDQSFASTEEDTDDVTGSEQIEATLDTLCQRGDWDALWDTAAKHDVPTEDLSKYVAIRANQLLQEDQKSAEDAVDILLKHPLNLHGNMSLFNDLARQILQRNKQQEDESDQPALVCKLKTLLHNVATKSPQPTDPSTGSLEFADLLMATHYVNAMNMCTDLGLNDLGAKCAVSLLRYAHIIPADKVFYLAGVLLRDQGHTDLAFVLLNRYVDLIEAIEDDDCSIDNSDFADENISSSIVDAQVPSEQYLTDEDDREDIRDWVLSNCMESGVKKELPAAKDAAGTIYAGLFQSPQPSCIITGFPVSKNDEMRIDQQYTASRQDWNTIVGKSKKCPWTGEGASPVWQ